jgi:hypothetical protein
LLPVPNDLCPFRAFGFYYSKLDNQIGQEIRGFSPAKTVSLVGRECEIANEHGTPCGQHSGLKQCGFAAAGWPDEGDVSAVSVIKNLSQIVLCPRVALHQNIDGKNMAV